MKWKSLSACRLKAVCGQKGGHQLPESVGLLGCSPLIVHSQALCPELDSIQAAARGLDPTNVGSDREPAFLDCVLRKGRRDGHDSVALLSGKVPVSNGTHLGSIFAAVEWVDGQARCTSVTREITRDCVRLCRKFWAQDGRRGGGIQVALEAFLRRLKGWQKYERCTSVYGRLREIGSKNI